MPDETRRDLERRVAADPSDAEAHVALRALDEREGIVPPRLLGRQIDELQHRAINDEDPIAQAELTARFAAANEVVVEEREGDAPLVGVFGPQPTTAVSPRVSRVAPITGGLMAFPHKAPLWDRETFGDGIDTDHRYYFRSMRQDAQGRPKIPAHSSGGMPRGYDFFLYEFVVLVDAGSDAAQAEHLWNHGKVTFLLNGAPANDWPMRDVMFPPRGIPTGLVARTRMLWPLGGVNVTVAGRPIRLQSVQDWHFRIDCAGLECLPVMISLKGIRLRSEL